MHGLVNSAIQGFVVDTCGARTWEIVVRASGTGIDRFEPLQTYDDRVTGRILGAVEGVLERPLSRVLEGIGHWLVAGRGGATMRRLLRFAGSDFVEFLYSLEDLPGRARLAVPDFILPLIEVEEDAPGAFRIRLSGAYGFGHVLFGLLDAMAEDYGVRVVLARADPPGGGEELRLGIAGGAAAQQAAGPLRRHSA